MSQSNFQETYHIYLDLPDFFQSELNLISKYT